MPSIEYWFLLHYEDYTGLLKGYPAVSNRLAPYMKGCFTDSSKGFKQLLKREKYLKDATWVKNLCADGKLLEAIKDFIPNFEHEEKGKNLDQKM